MLLSPKISKILIPLDGSKTSMRGFKTGLYLAKCAGAKILGLTVSPLIFSKNTTIKNEIQTKNEKIIQKAQKLADKDGVSFEGYVKFQDNIGKTIVDFASKDSVDLIIIGSRGPDPAFGVFLGSVANYVSHKSKIPVTIIK